jgi:hypothetical protein
MEKDTATPEPSSMTPRSGNPWKAAVILLLVVLGAVLICATLVVSGVMRLGLSLL